VFTGCDAVSAFHGKGEKCAWQTWYVWPEESIVFRKLSQYPPVLGEEKQSILEKFVVTMYDRLSATDNIDVVRLELFFRKQRSYDSTPPTQATLIQHIKRVKWKPKSVRTGVGRSKMTRGKSFGQHFHQLLRVANILRNVAARLNAVAGASAIVFVFLA
jgi:hypothetical protein